MTLMTPKLKVKNYEALHYVIFSSFHAADSAIYYDFNINLYDTNIFTVRDFWPRTQQKLEDHPLSAVRDCLFCVICY
jgi:hypothetical protein